MSKTTDSPVGGVKSNEDLDFAIMGYKQCMLDLFDSAVENGTGANYTECDNYLKQSIQAYVLAQTTATYELGVKWTIAHLLRMNLENPEAPVDVDEVNRRAIAQYKELTASLEQQEEGKV